MSDFNTTLELIKRAAVEAVNASKPTTICFGKVISAAPLKINVEQKMTLTEKQIVLSRNVTNFQTMITVNWATENHTHEHGCTEPTCDIKPNTHKHSIMGKKNITVHNGLVVGDEVIMVRMQGGQKYIVLDRIAV